MLWHPNLVFPALQAKPRLAVFPLGFFHLIHPSLLTVLVGLEVVFAHRSVTTITSQALQAFVGCFLAWVEVLAIALACEACATFLPF